MLEWRSGVLAGCLWLEDGRGSVRLGRVAGVGGHQ